MKKFFTLVVLLVGLVLQVNAVKIKGSWDSWVEHTLTFIAGNTYSISLTLTGNSTFEFCIDNGSIYKNNGTMTWYNCTNWTFNTTDNNCHIITVDPGTYTFIWKDDVQTLSVTYPTSETETVYFYNNHSWASPIVYLLGSSYWDNDKGSGSVGRASGIEMSQIGSTDVWMLEYPKSLGSQYIAFVKDRQDNYDNFWNTEAVYKDDFNSSKPLYVPNTTDPVNKNYTDGNSKWTAYWIPGAWHPFPTYTRNVTEGNYGTICLPFAATVTGAKVYQITGKVLDGDENVTAVNLVEVNGLVAGVAYIFKATGSTLTATLSGNYADVATGNAMLGSYTAGTNVPTDNYIVYDNKIRKAGTGVTVGQYKGYIIPENIPDASSRSANYLSFEDETTGIAGVEMNDDAEQNVVYNLNGQRVMNPSKGLYIVNGKKVIIK